MTRCQGVDDARAPAPAPPHGHLPPPPRFRLSQSEEACLPALRDLTHLVTLAPLFVCYLRTSSHNSFFRFQRKSRRFF